MTRSGVRTSTAPPEPATTTAKATPAMTTTVPTASSMRCFLSQSMAGSTASNSAAYSSAHSPRPFVHSTKASMQFSGHHHPLAMRHGCPLVSTYLRRSIANGLPLLRQSCSHCARRPSQYAFKPDEETRTMSRRTFIVLMACWNFVRSNSFSGIQACSTCPSARRSRTITYLARSRGPVGPTAGGRAALQETSTKARLAAIARCVTETVLMRAASPEWLHSGTTWSISHERLDRQVIAQHRLQHRGPAHLLHRMRHHAQRRQQALRPSSVLPRADHRQGALGEQPVADSRHSTGRNRLPGGNRASRQSSPNR
jgi:hypothetical protein